MSLVSQYAHGRSQLLLTSDDLIVSSGGSTTAAATLYFCLQGENPVGYSLPSAIVGPVTIPIGSRLVWTLPPDVRGLGESWTGYSLSASLTNTPSSFVQLARVAAVDSSENLISLPYTLSLGSDSQFLLSQTVLNAAALPLSVVSGMRRGVYDLGFVYEYVPDSDRAIDNLAVLPAGETLPGRWLRVGGFTNDVSDTTDPGGCAQDIRDINEQVVRYPRYGCDGSNGRKVGFWLTNTGNAAIPSGQRVLISVLMQEIPRSGAFEGALRAIFRGYANIATGAVRTTNPDGSSFRGLNNPIVFENRKTDLLFDDDLQPGEAYWLEILPNFIPAYFNYGVANHSLIKVFITIASQAGAFAAGGGGLGNRIYKDYDRGLCVPIIGAGVQVLKRSGLVNSREFLAIGATMVAPLTANMAGQQIRINGNGAVYLGTGSILDTEATRAVVDMVAGTSDACALSAPVFVEGGSSTSEGLSVTLAYPSNGMTATVRSNYPDLLLAGNTHAKLNPIFVTIYIKIGSTIKAFANNLLVDGATQTILLNDWNDGTVITSLPSAPNVRFCLFTAISATAVAVSGGSNFPDGNAQVSYAFQYDGTTVSAISHARADGCLHTATMDLADVEDSVQYWAPAVATFGQLPVATLIGQIRQTIDTGFLYRWTGTLWALATTPQYWGDPVANVAALPTVDAPIGQVRLTLDSGKLYRLTDTGWKLTSGASSVGGGNGILNLWRLT